MQELDIDVKELLNKITERLKDILEKRPDAKIIGIRKGGEWIAQYLNQALNLNGELGVIDSAFYRDDFAQSGLSRGIKPSHIPWEVEGQHLILVDDVLFTGRTVRSALNEIFDFGRPASVTLVALFDRTGCRELPFQADVVGMEVSCSNKLNVTGPDPIRVTMTKVEVPA